MAAPAARGGLLGSIGGALGGSARVAPGPVDGSAASDIKGHLSEGLKSKMDSAVAKVNAVAQVTATIDPSKGPQCAQCFFKETGRVGNFIFVPDGNRLTPPKLNALMYNTWKLKECNKLLTCDAGTVHPRMFASRNLAQLPKFAQVWSDAQLHAERAGVEAGEPRLVEALNVVNDVIFLKLVTSKCARAHEGRTRRGALLSRHPSSLLLWPPLALVLQPAS